VQEALQRSLLINCTHDHILRLLPPFIIRRADVQEFLRKLEAVLATAQKSAAKARSAAHLPHAASHGKSLASAAAR
jgi:hypothetical protein